MIVDHALNANNGARFEALSTQEEIEQSLIERCINVDVKRGVTTAKLPFIMDPWIRLEPNEHEALKVFLGQVKKLKDNPEDKLAVIESEEKLQTLRFVDYVSNLDDYDQNLIVFSDIKYFIPWRSVWNDKSLITPSRLVFDTSQGTKTGVQSK